MPINGQRCFNQKNFTIEKGKTVPNSFRDGFDPIRSMTQTLD